jgi:hypothetical protein
LTPSIKLRLAQVFHLSFVHPVAYIVGDDNSVTRHSIIQRHFTDRKLWRPTSCSSQAFPELMKVGHSRVNVAESRRGTDLVCSRASRPISGLIILRWAILQREYPICQLACLAPSREHFSRVNIPCVTLENPTLPQISRAIASRTGALDSP